MQSHERYQNLNNSGTFRRNRGFAKDNNGNVIWDREDPRNKYNTAGRLFYFYNNASEETIWDPETDSIEDLAEFGGADPFTSEDLE